MEAQSDNNHEYQNLQISQLIESKTNPRRNFDEQKLRELAETIRDKGVYSPLLVRPNVEGGFEIVFGARRFRAAQIAKVETVPIRIRQMTDAEVLEAQLVENLQRSDVHPMEEAQGFHALLSLEEPTYTVEQIAAKMGKSPAYVTTRLKLIDLSPVVVEAFYDEQIGVGHALLLAKLQPAQQVEALPACFKEIYGGGSGKPARILLPVRNLQFWIDTNVVLALKDAPFDKRDAQLVPTVGSCVDCPKRTGHNKLLFSDIGGKLDCCTDPVCYQSKVAAHVAKTVASKPNLVQISTSHGRQAEGVAALARGKYTAIREEKPKTKEEAKRPEFKVCKFTAEAIVTDGLEVGALRKVCTNPKCPVHHPQRQESREGERWEAQEAKRRQEEAVSNATGLRVLAAIGAAVSVRLLKRDLLFVNLHLAELVGEGKLETLARQHGLKRSKENENIGKLFAAFLRRADEGSLSRLIVEQTIVLAASRTNGGTVLREAATIYKVDADAIQLTVKQKFAARAKAKKEAKAVPKAKKVA